MWETIDQVQTDAALDFRATHPQAPRPAKPSFWGQMGEFLVAPVKGVGQAGLQTGRLANRVAPLQAGNPLAMTPAEQEEMLGGAGITRDSQDRALRRGIDALKPDPVTATTASMILQDASRVLSKVGMYAVTGGTLGAVVGTGLDEGSTGYLELRDRGVDKVTAAKAGAVRGTAVAVGVALPVAGRTLAQTIGLALVGGPGSMIAEQATTRAILEAANYPDIAREFDPFDPVGLGVSIVIPGVVGAVAHRARMRAGGAPSENADRAAALADDGDVRDAAHVAFRAQEADGAMLGDPAEPAARAAHVQAMDDARRALDEGEPMLVDPIAADPQRVQAAAQSVQERVGPMGDVSPGVRVPDAFMNDDLNIDPKARAYTMPTVEAMSEAQWLAGPARFSELAATRSGPKADEGWSASQAAQIEVVARKIVDFNERNGGARVPPEVAQNFMDQAQRQADETRVIDQQDGEPAPMAVNPLDRASRVIDQRPDLPVRLDDDGSPATTAGDAMELARDMHQRNREDSRAFEAAVQCFLENGQ